MFNSGIEEHFESDEPLIKAKFISVDKSKPVCYFGTLRTLKLVIFWLVSFFMHGYFNGNGSFNMFVSK